MALAVTCPGCHKELHVREEHAGRKFKCPQCAAIIEVPAADNEVTEIAEVVESVTDAAPAARRGPPPVPRRSEEEEDTHEAAVIVCPRCGEPTPADAERCRHCRARLDTPRKPRPKYVPCPRCDAPDPEPVSWTVWGSFRECGYAYNGVSGKSNLVPAILFITIPLVLIVGLVIFIIVLLINR
jgi:DNA-directed RNA polymerase subunit M/transcription elongation factor TFIIS